MSQFVGGPSKQIRDGRLSNIYVDTVFANSIQAASGAGTPARQSGTFTVYIAAAGDDTNDGLTVSTPVLTFARALAIFKGVSYDEFVLSIANDFATFDPTVDLPNDIQVDKDVFIKRAIDLSCINGHCQTFRFLGNPDTYDISDANYTNPSYDIATLYGDGNASVGVANNYFRKYVVADTSLANNPTIALHDGKYAPILSSETTATDFYVVSSRSESGTVSLYGGSTTSMTKMTHNGDSKTVLLASCNVIFERLSFEYVSEAEVAIEIHLSCAPALHYYGCVCESFTSRSSSTMLFYFGCIFTYGQQLRYIENVEFHECYFDAGVNCVSSTIRIADSVLFKGIQSQFSQITFNNMCVLISFGSFYAVNASNSNINVLFDLLFIGITESDNPCKFINCNITNGAGDVESKGYISCQGTNINSQAIWTIVSTAATALELKESSTCVLLNGQSFSSATTAVVLRSGSKLLTLALTNNGAGSNTYQRGTATASTTFAADDADTGVANTEGTMVILRRS